MSAKLLLRSQTAFCKRSIGRLDKGVFLRPQRSPAIALRADVADGINAVSTRDNCCLAELRAQRPHTIPPNPVEQTPRLPTKDIFMPASVENRAAISIDPAGERDHRLYRASLLGGCISRQAHGKLPQLQPKETRPPRPWVSILSYRLVPGGLLKSLPSASH